MEREGVRHGGQVLDDGTADRLTGDFVRDAAANPHAPMQFHIDRHRPKTGPLGQHFKFSHQIGLVVVGPDEDHISLGLRHAPQFVVPFGIRLRADLVVDVGRTLKIFTTYADTGERRSGCRIANRAHDGAASAEASG